MPDNDRNVHPNVRSAKYLIVESKTRCDQCKGVTAVFAFALPTSYESLYVDDDTPDDESGTWETRGIAAVLSYVEYLPEAVADRVRSVTQHYRLDRDCEIGGTFWTNHCEHCGAPMEEEELHGDPGRPFGPMPDLGLEVIRLHEVHEPFSPWAGCECHDLRQLDS
jgi:hypothetical protein